MRAEFVRSVANAAGVVSPREAGEVSRSQQASNRAFAAVQTTHDPSQRKSAVEAVMTSEDRVRSVQQAQLQRRQQDVMRASAAIARQSMSQTREAVKVLAVLNNPVGRNMPSPAIGSLLDRLA